MKTKPNARSSRRVRFAVCALIFLLAFGVRILSWHDTRLEVGKVQTAVTADYKRVAQLLREGGIRSFLSPTSPLADLNNLGHPPGYSILLALIYSRFGQTDTAVQFVQIICDALAAVVIFLIVADLFPSGAGIIAGLLAAFSPQFAWNSVLLLPDSLSVFPVLLAIYLLARAAKNPRLLNFLIIGALVAISCWLRPNAMLLSFFLAAAVPLLVKAERRWRYALAVVCGTLLIVLPLTIRNAIVFHRFIPVSLGAGQTLLEGISDYDAEGRFGIPRTDMGIMKQEAEQFRRPDYENTLFNPDGVERERARLSRGFAVIRSHPLWFSGVMIRRGASMLRLERSRLISDQPPVSHLLDTDTQQPVWVGAAINLFSAGTAAPQAHVSNEAATQRMSLEGDDSKYGEQFSISLTAPKKNMDYVLTAPIQIEKGRMRISVEDSAGKVCASEIVETVEGKLPELQPVSLVRLSFVTDSDSRLRLILSNEASNPPRPVIKVGSVKLFELGPARFLWTCYPRFLVHAVQRIFLTAVILPLAIIGLLFLIFRKQSRALVILSIVPLYYFTIQSIVHTEYRYVLAVDYFLFAFAAVAVWSIAAFAIARARLFPKASSRSGR